LLNLTNSLFAYTFDLTEIAIFTVAVHPLCSTWRDTVRCDTYKRRRWNATADDKCLYM